MSSNTPIQKKLAFALKQSIGVKKKHVHVEQNKDGSFEIKISKISEGQISKLTEYHTVNTTPALGEPKEEVLGHTHPLENKALKLSNQKPFKVESHPAFELIPSKCHTHSDHLVLRLMVDEPCIMCMRENLNSIIQRRGEVGGAKTAQLLQLIDEFKLEFRPKKHRTIRNSVIKTPIYLHFKKLIQDENSKFEQYFTKIFPINTDFNVCLKNNLLTDQVNFISQNHESQSLVFKKFPIRLLSIKIPDDAKELFECLNTDNSTIVHQHPNSLELDILRTQQGSACGKCFFCKVTPLLEKFDLANKKHVDHIQTFKKRKNPRSTIMQERKELSKAVNLYRSSLVSEVLSHGSLPYLHIHHPQIRIIPRTKTVKYRTTNGSENTVQLLGC